MLLRLDVSKMPANPNNRRADGDFPLAWAKSYGKGRVFYSSLGHAAETWDNRDVAQMYFEAIKWSLGLTEGDATPRPLANVASRVLLAILGALLDLVRQLLFGPVVAADLIHPGAAAGVGLTPSSVR